MTHGSHQSRLPPPRRRARPPPPDGRRRLLPDLRDGRRPAPDRRRARAEVLAAALRAARPPGSRRPRVRARTAGARRAVPDADARATGSSCSSTRTRASARCSRSTRRRASLPKLAAIAFALLGIHVGPHRVMPVGYAPAWSPSSERIAYVTRGDLWVADRDGTHRSLLVRVADQPAWGPNGRRHRLRARRLGLDGARRRARRAAARTRRASRLVARRQPARLRPRRRDLHGALVVRRRPEGRRRAAPTRPTRPTGGSRSSATARSSSAATPSRPARRPTGRRTGGWRGSATASSTSPASATTAACSRPGTPRSKVRELLPDFDQRAPSGLVIAGGAGHVAARLHVARRQPRPGQLGARRRPAAGRVADDRHAARPARERQDPRLRGRRAVPLHELTAAPSLASDALRLVRAAHARRPHARARPQERLLPRRPLGRRARLLSRPSSGLPRRLRAVPPGGD